MVIRGNSRGNARQLSHYLLARKENEAIRILNIDGQDNPTAEELHQAIFMMGVSAELSRSEKGLYHAQINPAIGEDKLMQDDHWLEAADILGKQLGLEQQRRAIVLHTKKGRTHAHVVWERFDHTNQKMVSDSFSRLAQDRARKEMETTFGQTQTPHRNKHRPELKASLSALWHQTGTGAQFVTAARRNGYIISEGSGRSPFMVVDENARSYDLTRQLQGVRLKDVRQRLRGESLMGEKDAITLARKKQNEAERTDGGTGTGKQKATLKTKINTMQEEFAANKDDMAANDKSRGQQNKNQLQDNKADITQGDKPKEKELTLKEKLAASKREITGQQPDKSVKEEFAENKDDTSKSDKQKDKERRKEEFKKQFQPKPVQSQTRDKGLELD
ncbi:MAG: relaxase/mobilization nuclease domain-containing protein [Flavipsychrobacter sp.]